MIDFFINIFKLPVGIKQHISNHVDFIASISLILFLLTTIALKYSNITYINYFTYVYLFWGLIGIYVNPPQASIKIKILYVLPIFIWISIIIYVYSFIINIKLKNKYSAKEFFYNDKFEDYNNEI